MTTTLFAPASGRLNVPDIKVIGEAGEGREALRLVGELKPDVVLLDISLPGTERPGGRGNIAEGVSLRPYTLSLDACE